MKNKKSLVIYFSAVILLVVFSYALKNTFAYFVANEKGTATDMKVAKLGYILTSTDLKDNTITLKPYEVKKITINVKNDYDVATIYRLNYEGNVTVLKSSVSENETKGLIDMKSSKDVVLVLKNSTDKNQLVKFTADGGYVGNDLEDGNITQIYDETLLLNKVMLENNLVNENGIYRDTEGTKNYVKIGETVYRVLGVSLIDDEEYLKLITNESIGKQLFGENNNYITSSLNTYLNLEYKNSLNSVIKDNLKEVTYYTAGVDKVLDNREDYYKYERGNYIANEGFNKEGKSSIGLMYLSDYVGSETWLKTNVTEYTIMPNSSDETKVFCINYKEDKVVENNEEKIVSTNTISSDCNVKTETDVRPVMYLQNKLVVASGAGSLEDPYIIK